MKRYRRPLIILTGVVLLLALLAWGSRERPITEENVRRMASEWHYLSRFAEWESPDFRSMNDNYRAGPRRLVRRIDDSLAIELDEKIEASFDQGRRGRIPRVNAQIIDLTILRVFFEFFQQLLASTGDDARALSRVVAEVLEPRLTPGAGDFGADQATTMREFAAGDAGVSPDGALAAARTLVVINLLADLDSAANHATTDTNRALWHLARALQFLHMIYPHLTQVDREAATFLQGEFTRHPAKIEYAGCRERLRGALENELPDVPWGKTRPGRDADNGGDSDADNGAQTGEDAENPENASENRTNP
ncbi:hypothetical protein K8I61_20050 [bacterium]|nr:hypothetical protein [bacterium]